MAHILIMPRQGNTVESCIITDWKVAEGDSVTAETAVCGVETDKATFEVPAGAAGVVLKILRESGDDVPVLEPIAVIGQAGESWEFRIEEGGMRNEGRDLGALGETPVGTDNWELRSEEGGLRNEGRDLGALGETPVGTDNNVSQPSASSSQSATLAPRPSILNPQSSPPISPRARNLAAKEAFAPEMAPGTGPGGRVIERDVIAALAERPGLTAAARAAIAGGAEGVPAAGTGIGGRITAADIAGGRGQSAAGSQSSATAFSVAISHEGAITETPIKGIRKLIADRMFQSLAESAQFTLTASAPAVRMQELRARMKAAEGLGLAKITVNDLILFAVSRILPRFPFMNALKIGDTLKTFERVHLGCAVDTPRGLVVPVIRNANLLPLTAISAEAKRLAAACQSGGAKPDELSGSTFTVTNLGSLGVTSFTPVLNAPEVAILGVCGIELKPVADETALAGSGGVKFEPHIGFSLTINHQVVDGAPAARFLKALCEAVADIDLLLAADRIEE